MLLLILRHVLRLPPSRVASGAAAHVGSRDAARAAALVVYVLPSRQMAVTHPAGLGCRKIADVAQMCDFRIYSIVAGSRGEGKGACKPLGVDAVRLVVAVTSASSGGPVRGGTRRRCGTSRRDEESLKRRRKGTETNKEALQSGEMPSEAGEGGRKTQGRLCELGMWSSEAGGIKFTARPRLLHTPVWRLS